MWASPHAYLFFCEWISFLIIIHTHQQKNPSIRGHSLKNVDTFWRQNLNVEHSDSSFSMRSLLLLFFTHQFHNTKMKKKLPFPPYYYCCQVQKNCDTLWYETTYHILHTTTQPPHKHTLKLPLTKKVNKQLTSAAADPSRRNGRSSQLTCMLETLMIWTPAPQSTYTAPLPLNLSTSQMKTRWWFAQ